MGTSKVKVDFSEIRKAAETLSQANTALLLENITNELGVRLLAKAIKRTPVDKGALRRGWDASIGAKAVNTGGGYTVTITNSVEYASYVEFGHRQTPGRYVPAIGKSLKKSWVTGRFFLTKAELELEKELLKIIEKKLEAWIKEVLGG
nr:MAG TPA: type I neck protein [Caudoviricetes sp.]